MYRFLFVIAAISCNSDHNQDKSLANKSVDSSLTKFEKLSNNNTLEKGKVISYNEFIDDRCNSNDEFLDNNVTGTHIILNVNTLDSFYVYNNDSLFYTGELNNGSNRIIILYNLKLKKKLTQSTSICFVDTTKVNTFKIEFKKQHSFLEFKMLRYSKRLVITDTVPKWTMIYSNCVTVMND